MAERIPLFVVAIDFGTTYSGYAYSATDDYKTDPARVWANQNWHAQGAGLLSRKTPSCLLLTPEKEFQAFGYEAEEEYAQLTAANEHEQWYYFHRFKMKLHGEENIEEDLIIEDQTGKPLLAITVFSKSIAYLKQTFMEELESKDIEIKDHEINWVLTVPAIWNDSAKRFMRTAAVKAGINSKNLKIALEPEAASLFCQHEKTERETGEKSGFSAVGPGTKYMVVDLGGGTVDITVHEKLERGMLKEIYRTSGGSWGGTAVDEAYIQLLTRIVGGPTMHHFRKECLYDYLDMLREFEVTKRTVKPSGKKNTNFKIPVNLNSICEELNGETIGDITKSQNFPFHGQIKVIADKLSLSHEIVRQIFKDVTDKIVDHLDEVLKHESTRDVSLMLLVGGFAQSPVVQDTIKSRYKTEERRVVVPQEAGLSVVKGAVMFGHHPTTVQSRILRYTYGTGIHVTYDPNKYPESRKITINCMDTVTVFDPFIKAGTPTDNGHTVTENAYCPAWMFDEDLVHRVYVTSNSDTKYPDDPDCKVLKKIPVGKLLPPLPNQDRNCVIQYIFGDTEVEIILKEEATGFRYSDTFDLQE